MFKKSLLVLGLLSGVQDIRTENEVLKGMTIGAITAGTILYWANRETNAEKIKRANDLWSTTQDDLYRVENLQDLEEFFSIYQYLKENIKKSYLEINARYSFIKPWNWSNEMCETHQKISLLHTIFSSQHIMFLTSNPDEGQLLHHLRKHYPDVRYSLLKAASELARTIRTLKNSSYQTTANTLLINLLMSALNQLKVSNEYDKEWYNQAADNIRNIYTDVKIAYKDYKIEQLEKSK